MNASEASYPTLGVLQCEAKGVLPFTEAAYCRRLSIAGRKHGIHVMVFSPLWIHWSDHTVHAFVYTKSGWERHWLPLPALAYDRCTYTDNRQYRKTQVAIARMMEQANVRLLGVGLRGKWEIYRSLRNDSYLSPILPPTRLFAGVTSLTDQLSRCQGGLFLKPHGGTHGKSTLHIHLHRNSEEKAGSKLISSPLELRGRDDNNEAIHHLFPHPQEGFDWIERFVGNRRFIIQPYLALVTQEGEPFDIRVLMQKDESGRWDFTGMAARIGQPNSVTSNLHGGGRAVPVIPFLVSQFEPNHVQRLIKQLCEYSKYIPPLLEAQYGRISEIGLDFGIDRDARLWLLEVNSKPGRSVFKQTGEHEAALKSVENPILYARHMLVRYLRRVSS